MPNDGLPTVPGRASQSSARRDRQPALGHPVVLDQDRPEPIHHLLLDVLRARLAAVQHGAQRRRAESAAAPRGQRQELAEHGRHHAGRAHVASERVESGLRVPALEDAHRAAAREERQREGERRAVEERRDVQVRAVGREMRGRGGRARGDERLAPRKSAVGEAVHALRPAGGAGGVREAPALPVARQRAASPAPRASARSPRRDAALEIDRGDAGCRGRRARRVDVGHDRARAGVAQDVLDLGRGPRRLDGRHDHPGPRRSEERFDELDAVARDQCDVVARRHAERLEPVPERVGALLELAEAHPAPVVLEGDRLRRHARELPDRWRELGHRPSPPIAGS